MKAVLSCLTMSRWYHKVGLMQNMCCSANAKIHFYPLTRWNLYIPWVHFFVVALGRCPLSGEWTAFLIGWTCQKNCDLKWLICTSANRTVPDTNTDQTVQRYMMTSWRGHASCITGVGVTRPISTVPLISRFFTIVKTLVTYWTACSYLTGVAAAQLRWHLSNMNVMQII